MRHQDKRRWWNGLAPAVLVFGVIVGGLYGIGLAHRAQAQAERLERELFVKSELLNAVSLPSRIEVPTIERIVPVEIYRGHDTARETPAFEPEWTR